MNVVNRKNLAGIVSCITKLQKDEIDEILEITFHVIIDQVEAGRKVRISGFGSFDTVVRKSKKGRDFSQGKTIRIPNRKVPIYRASSVFRSKIK